MFLGGVKLSFPLSYTQLRQHISRGCKLPFAFRCSVCDLAQHRGHSYVPWRKRGPYLRRLLSTGEANALGWSCCAHFSHHTAFSPSQVPLKTHVIGQGKLSDQSSSMFHFFRSLDRNVPEIIIRFSDNNPAIVFCHTKADTEKLADLLATAHRIGQRSNATTAIAGKTRVSKLQRVLMYGIAYHHSGLEVDDRRLVERSFMECKIRVLCATSTLAMGVNLPAHLVVIKGTKAWRGGEVGYQDIEQSSLLQMIGRAGRPGFSTSGTAVIMTDNDSKARFEKLASSGLSTARSQCVGHKFVETFNAEVSQRVITSIEAAVNWIKSTLHYIQLTRDPGAHGINVVSSLSIETHLLGVCTAAAQRLRSVGALVIADSQDIFPLAASHTMSQHLVDYNVMDQISKLPFDASQCQLLRALAQIEGLQRPVRRPEKKVLNAAHKALKKYKLEGQPSKVRVKEPWQKAFVLLQVYIDELELEGNDFTLRQELNSMVEYASRMLAAIEEYSQKSTKNGIVLVQSLLLRRSLAVHLWNANDGILRQIKGVGKTLAFNLHMGGISTFDDVLKRSDEQIEKAAGRSSPFGRDLREASKRILDSRMKISATLGATSGSLAPNITCSVDYQEQSSATHESSPNGNGKAPVVSYTLIGYTDRPGGCILFKENITGPAQFTVLIPDKYGKIVVRLVASIVGLDGKKRTGNGSASSLCSRTHSSSLFLQICSSSRATTRWLHRHSPWVNKS